MAQLSPTTLLFAGETATARLTDGTAVPVRVRLVPVRSLLTLLDLFDAGREAELIAAAVERSASTDTAAPVWVPVDAPFVDSLADESHLALVEQIKALNFTRAVSYAERQIASGSALLPLKQRLTAQLLHPVKAEMESWASSLTQRVSVALAAKQP